MINKYLRRSLFLLSFVFVLACSSDETKNNATTPIASRPTVPIQNSEVQIGTQIWMTKNLNVSRYRNGDPIPQVTNHAQWEALTTGAWCYYENNTANGRIYGKLYNWYAVNDPRGLAPAGWHVPTDSEWDTLIEFLGGYGIAGGKLKATTMWSAPNAFADNSSGFTALPGGMRAYNDNITFYYVGSYGNWWTSSNEGGLPAFAWKRAIHYLSEWVSRGEAYMYSGFSVRCIKN